MSRWQAGGCANVEMLAKFAQIDGPEGTHFRLANASSNDEQDGAGVCSGAIARVTKRGRHNSRREAGIYLLLSSRSEEWELEMTVTVWIACRLSRLNDGISSSSLRRRITMLTFGPFRGAIKSSRPRRVAESLLRSEVTRLVAIQCRLPSESWGDVKRSFGWLRFVDRLICFGLRLAVRRNGRS